MNAKRKAVQDYILKYLKMMEPTGKNVKLYENKFKEISDARFDEWMKYIRDGKCVLSVYVPIGVKINIDDLLKTAKELGIKLSTRLKFWDDTTGTYYTTAHEYVVLELPIRRMAQFIDHKLSVPEGDSHVDLLSGQVMKPDKAGGLNQTEVQALYARGLTNTILELIKYRGGDVTALAEYNRELEETGRTTIGRDTGSVVRSAVILDVLYSGMHIETNASGI